MKRRVGKMGNEEKGESVVLNWELFSVKFFLLFVPQSVWRLPQGKGDY